MARSVDDSTLVESWHTVLDRHARITGALEHALSDHQLGVSEYEVLERLHANEDDGCRMHNLAESMHLSQSALSRVVGRLEEDGLVERKMCAEDRRGIYAALTKEGRKRYEEARPVHRAVLAEYLATSD
jgi:DNA-binding MarR family transcriptional regulator